MNKEKVNNLDKGVDNYIKIDFTKLIKISLYTFLVPMVFVIPVMIFTVPVQYKVDIKPLKTKLIPLISNNSDIKTIQHVYKRGKNNKVTFYSMFTKKDKEVIDIEEMSLNNILLDIKSGILTKLELTLTDTLLLESLDNTIIQFNELNPFDKLEDQQKYFFENIRTKLDSNYHYVQEDINKISDELDRKNVLVSNYLNNAKWSFRISIFAICVSVSSLLIGIIVNIKNSKKEGE